MVKFCVFAGTTEGRTIVEYLCSAGAGVLACVATEYGEALLPEDKLLRVRAGRMDEGEMERMLREEKFSLVLDATHPYAREVTENIAAACAAAGTEYLRVLRSGSDDAEGALFVPDVAAAVEMLSRAEGNILLTTGSRSLPEFAAIRDFPGRVYARVLPAEASLAACRAAGMQPDHVIAMQGPFSEELNTALLRAVRARFLVTKDSGAAGGFAEKARAAAAAGARLVVLGRPPEREGLTLSETLETLAARFGLRCAPRVTVAGIGPGAPEALTGAVRAALREADCLIGARRMLEYALPRQAVFEAVAPEAIAEIIRAHPEHRRFAVAMSGDTGFFSGTKRLLPFLDFCAVTVLPGLSSLAYLCARLGKSWDDVLPVSLHGRARDIVPDVRANPRVFALTGGDNSPAAICRRLTAAGLGGVGVCVGERLSYPDERLCAGTAAELAEREFAPLSAMLIENGAPDALVTPGRADEEFLRLPAVPMTKSEVRAVALSKLRLTERSVCWDIGAGTGSVSVEMALMARRGSVYAVERSAEALQALRENKARFSAENLTVVPGAAPEVCQTLPAPTHVFLGGSGGRAREIVALALEMNPAARIVAAAVTLETVSELTACLHSPELSFTETEAVSLTVARDRAAGPYRLMTGQNPVYLFTMQGGGA